MKVTRVLNDGQPLFEGEFNLTPDGSDRLIVGDGSIPVGVFCLSGEVRLSAQKHLHADGVVSFGEAPGRKFWYLRRAEGGTNVQMWFLELPHAVAAS